MIFAPAVLFFFLEFQDLPLGERIWSSLFQSVTTRTAGFNTADLAGMTDSGKMGNGASDADRRIAGVYGQAV